MADELRNILEQFNPDEPYVWRLHLDDEIYQLLEAYIAEKSASMNKDIAESDARLVIVYLAEWYRRLYKGSETGQTNAADDIDLKRVWEVSGIRTDRYVYQTEAGTRLWKYSIYVLGGLAVRHELGRHDNGRFLKALCRLFHGEDYTLENLDDESRAVAFRQSIAREHSLYEYLKEILDCTGEQHRDKETLALMDAIRTANDDVLRKKFTLEWIVVNQPTSPYMKRMLRVALKPEQIGGGLHQYLRFDRLRVWGVSNPERLRNIFIGIRWRNGDDCIQDLDKQNPLLVLSNTTNGFVTWGAEERVATERNIPVETFTHLDIVAYDNHGNEWIAQTEEAASCMQLWRMTDSYDRWTSKQQSQHATAVVFTNDWHSTTPADMQKVFKDKTGNTGTSWSWCYIQSDITLVDNKGQSMTLYNRNGYDQVFAILHKDTICYKEGGLVTVWQEDEEEGQTEERYPLIFGRDDLHVRHFRTKDAITEAEMDSEETCHDVQFKHNGRYEDWTEVNQPHYGLVQLRITEKNIVYRMTAYYLNGPILRCFDTATILYKDLDGKKQVYQDHIEKGGQPIEPTVTLRIGNCEVEIYRPTLLKELYLDGKVWKYIEEGEEFTLPWIYKDRIRIADFSAQGFRQYECSNMVSPFATFDKSEDNQALYHLINRTHWDAMTFDANAPQWLRICLAKDSSKPRTELPLLKWNIYQDKDPQPFVYEEGYQKQKGEVIFMDAHKPDADLDFFYTEPGRPDVFGGKKTKGIEMKCFETAVKFQTYFSGYHPIRQMAQRGETNQKLISQLKERYGETLSEDLRQGLTRLADEFQLDIEKLDINL